MSIACICLQLTGLPGRGRESALAGGWSGLTRSLPYCPMLGERACAQHAGKIGGILLPRFALNPGPLLQPKPPEAQPDNEASVAELSPATVRRITKETTERIMAEFEAKVHETQNMAAV